MDDLYLVPEGGGEPVRLTPISDVIFDTNAYYAYCNQSDLPHIALFSAESFECTFRMKRDIEKELPPRYFKKNLTCVWADRKRAIGILRDLDKWSEILRILEKQRRSK